jgi:hypothetical protein
MRYLAICLLSLIASSAMPNTLFVTAPASIQAAAAEDEPAEESRRDALALLVGGVLVVLQLRRRQKSLGMPRSLAG